MPVPALLALCASLMWGTADFLGGTLSRRISPVVVVAVSQAAALVIFFVAVLVFADLSQLGGVMPAAATAGITDVLAVMALYAALGGKSMSVVAPLASMGFLLPVCVGVIRGERPTGLEIFGASIAVLGSLLATGRDRSGIDRRSIVLALLAGLGFGMTMLLIAEGGKVNPLLTVFGMRVASVPAMVVLIALLWVSGRTTVSVSGRDLPPLAVLGGLDGTANLAYASAIGLGGLLTLTSVLGSLYPAVTVMLARVVHKEQMSRVQATGVSLTVLGVVMAATG